MFELGVGGVGKVFNLNCICVSSVEVLDDLLVFFFLLDFFLIVKGKLFLLLLLSLQPQHFVKKVHFRFLFVYLVRVYELCCLFKIKVKEVFELANHLALSLHDEEKL